MFSILQKWSCRVRPLGSVFALYLLGSGFERLLIEKIRVNPRFDLLGISFTQAELISVCLIFLGIGLWIVALPRRRRWLRLLIPLGCLALLSACVAL